MKKFISLFFAIIMTVSLCVVPVSADDTMKVRLCNYIDNAGNWVGEKYIKFDVKPQIINGRTMVPIRAVAEELGYKVIWNDYDKSVDIHKTFDNSSQVEKVTQYKDLVWLLYKLEGGTRIDNFSNRKQYWGSGFDDYTVDGMLYGDDYIFVGAGATVVINNKVGKTSMFGGYGGKGFDEMYFEYFMDVPPQIINGRTLIPLRAVGDMLGLKVEWNNNTRTVTLTA